MMTGVQSLLYVFVELYPMEILGDYELFAHRESFYAIITVAPCECIAMPSQILQYAVPEGEDFVMRLTREQLV